MNTSDNFDIFPVAVNKDVIIRSFESLAGFNKKGKKGKFSKAIKEEYAYDQIQKKWRDMSHEEVEAQKKAFHDRIAKKEAEGDIAHINLDEKKKKTTATSSDAKKKPTSEKYSGYLINKKGKTEKQIAQELKDKINDKKAETFKDDTDYTVKEMVKLIWPVNEKIRAKFSSPIAFEQKLKEDSEYRKKADVYCTKKFGLKEPKKTKTAKAQKEEAKIDIFKVSDYFWRNRYDENYKKFMWDIQSEQALRRMLSADSNALKQLATIMKNKGFDVSLSKAATTKSQVKLIKNKG